MSIFKNCLTNKEQGNVGEAKAIFDLIVMGYHVSKPLFDNQNYDLICEKNNNVYKVQVKTTKQKSRYNIPVVNLRVLGGNQSSHTVKKYNDDDFDLLYVLTDDNDSYLIPFNEICSKTTLNLGKNYSKYKIII